MRSRALRERLASIDGVYAEVSDGRGARSIAAVRVPEPPRAAEGRRRGSDALPGEPSRNGLSPWEARAQLLATAASAQQVPIVVLRSGSPILGIPTHDPSGADGLGTRHTGGLVANSAGNDSGAFLDVPGGSSARSTSRRSTARASSRKTGPPAACTARTSHSP